MGRDDFIAGVVAGAVGMGLCFLIVTTMAIEGNKQKFHILKMQAVERGFAEWAVQKDGSTVFTWKEKPSAKEGGDDR